MFSNIFCPSPLQKMKCKLPQNLFRCKPHLIGNEKKNCNRINKSFFVFQFLTFTALEKKGRKQTLK